MLAEVLERGEAIESWSISRHAEDVTPGDRAVLWVGARKAPGVDAVGTITGVPREGVVDDPDWPGEPQGSPVLWCPIDFDVVLHREPIARSDLKADPRFARSAL